MPVQMLSNSSRLTYAALWPRKQLAARNRLNDVSAVAFIIFIVMTFFVRGLHGVAVAPILVVALLSFRDGLAAEAFRRNAWLWAFLAFLAAWMALAAAIGSPGYKVSDFLNLALLGAFFLFVAQVSRALGARQVLAIVAVAGAASALASVAVHIVSAPHLFDRMFPLGRGGNPIPGAGGFAVALISLATLWFDRALERREAVLGFVLAIPLLAALAWTQSRAPIIALCLALPLALLLQSRGGAGAVLAACGAVWLVISSLVLLEPSIKSVLCSTVADWCRPAYRAEIWGWVRDQIALRPVLGSGPSFRFPREWMSHPHNGLLGITMFYGLAVLAAFGATIACYARQLVRQPDRTLRFFGLASLVFSFGYMGTDLSNPFAFFNMHYLFLWLPFFLNLAPGQTVGDGGGRELARSGSEGLRQT